MVMFGLLIEFSLHRLKTRMAWVQMAEEGLEEKRQHCQYFSHHLISTKFNHLLINHQDIKVVQAFENALALLADS